MKMASYLSSTAIDWESVMPNSIGRKEGTVSKKNFHLSKQLLKLYGFEIEELHCGIFGQNPLYGLTKKGKPRRYLLNADEVKSAALFAVVLSLEKNI
jgi:hypothetical protein